jgi:hypothetical protein
MELRGHVRVVCEKRSREAEMGVGDQFACASLVAAFSLALFITANLFVEARSSKSVVRMPAAQHMRVIPL